MKRPSRGFWIAAFALLLVVAAIVGLRIRMQPVPPRPSPPDVWERVGAPGDLRTSPDGPDVPGWVFFYREVGLLGGRTKKPYVALVAEGQMTTTGTQRWIDRLFGDPQDAMRRHAPQLLYEAGAPVTTASGQWQRFSNRWWDGANPIPAPAPAAK